MWGTLTRGSAGRRRKCAHEQGEVRPGGGRSRPRKGGHTHQPPLHVVKCATTQAKCVCALVLVKRHCLRQQTESTCISVLLYATGLPV